MAVSNKKLLRLKINRFLFVVLMPFLSHFALGSEIEIKAEQLHKLAWDRQWLNLLHYRQGQAGTWSSEVSDQNFFISSSGAHDPEAELLEMLDKIRQNSGVECRFPARYLFIKESLSLESTQNSCAEYEFWKRDFVGDRVSLVFASSFYGSPTSIFGHSFLMLSGGEQVRSELLAKTISFAAVISDSNPLVYGYKGLFGGYNGRYFFLPYYQLIKDYSHLENRDLWSYEIPFASHQLELFKAHLWEVRNLEEPYWFLSENCSTKLLQLLSVAEPKYSLENTDKKFISPLDSVLFVAKTDPKISVSVYRPAITQKYRLLERELSLAERQQVVDLTSLEGALSPLVNLSEPELVRLFDAALLRLQAIYPYEIENRQGPASARFFEILKLRSAVLLSSPVGLIDYKSKSPHLSHQARRFSIGTMSNSNSAGTLSFRFSGHDSLDQSLGFSGDQQYALMNFNFLVLGGDSGVLLDKLEIVHLRSLNFQSIDHSPSWQFAFDFVRYKNEQCYNCKLLAMNAGIGTSQLVYEKFIFDTSFKFHLSPRLWGAGPQFTLLSNWSDSWSGLIEAWFRKDQVVDYSEFKEVLAGVQYSLGQRYGLRILGVERWFEKQLDISLQVHF